MAFKIYIAAPFEMREQAIRIMHTIERHPSANAIVTSTWLREPTELEHRAATLDLVDVGRSNLLLAINPAEWMKAGTGGRHVEMGYALARGMPVVIVGVRSNLFHYFDAMPLLPLLPEFKPAQLEWAIRHAKERGVKPWV